MNIVLAMGGWVSPSFNSPYPWSYELFIVLLKLIFLAKPAGKFAKPQEQLVLPPYTRYATSYFILHTHYLSKIFWKTDKQGIAIVKLVHDKDMYNNFENGGTLELHLVYSSEVGLTPGGLCKIDEVFNL